MLFLEYIEDEKYGKVAHFINNNDESVFFRVVEAEGIIIYEELSSEVNNYFLKIINEEMDGFYYEN